MKKSKGFTIIEMVMVLAIVGLLTTIIMIALSNARNKAKDGKIQADLNQIRTAAGVYYNNQSPSSYSGLSCAVSNPNVSALCADINNQSPGNPIFVLKTGNAEYCVYKQLLNTKYACVDSAGNAEFNLSGPPATCVVATATCK
jgi:prepilin-type N-terminal cleavage/methylation domain-containing protein